jgi:uncharacterized membrane protein YfcA
MQSPWQWAVAALAAYLVGLSKTGIPGLGVLSVALFAGVLPARESTGIVLVVLIAADIVSVLVYRRQADWTQLVRLLPWAVVGIVLGWLVLGRIDSLTTQRLIGAILTGLILFQILRKWQTRHTPTQAPSGAPRPALAAVAGTSGGFTTMVANAAGPIMILYLLAMGLPKMVFMGTSVWYFFVLNLIKVPFSINLGLINPASLQISLLIAPFSMAGAVTGRMIIRYIDQRLFEWLALGLTLIAGIRLLVA